LCDHHPYRPDLAPSDYHLFTFLKNWVRLQYFNNNEELMEGSSQVADFFDTGTQQIIPRQDKWLNSGDDCVEK
jgi:hypothetical protein